MNKTEFKNLIKEVIMESKMLDTIESYELKTKDSIESKIKEMQDYLSLYQKKINDIKKLPIEDVLKEYGLEIDRISISVPGIGQDTKYFMEHQKLNVDIDASPLPKSKVKLVPFKGYTSGGAGKNKEQLTSQASKLKEFLKSKLNVGVMVNDYSFEIKSENDKKQISISLWV